MSEAAAGLHASVRARALLELLGYNAGTYVLQAHRGGLRVLKLPGEVPVKYLTPRQCRAIRPAWIAKAAEMVTL